MDSVEKGREERLVQLRHEASGRQVTTHLMDGWADMPVQPEDPVNLITTTQLAPDGSLHAVCDHAQGLSSGLLLLSHMPTCRPDSSAASWIHARDACITGGLKS